MKARAQDVLGHLVRGPGVGGKDVFVPHGIMRLADTLALYARYGLEETREARLWRAQLEGTIAFLLAIRMEAMEREVWAALCRDRELEAA